MASEIARLCRTLQTMINARDFDLARPDSQELVRKHISPTWEGRFDNEAHAIAFAEQLDIWRRLTTDHPEFYIDVLDLDIDVHKDGTTANVFMRSCLTGQNGVTMQGLCETKWKLRNGRWVWHHHHAMKGLREV